MRVTRKPPRIEAWQNSPHGPGAIPDWIVCDCNREEHPPGTKFMTEPSRGRLFVGPDFWVVKDEYGDIRIFTPAEFDELFTTTEAATHT